MPRGGKWLWKDYPDRISRGDHSPYEGQVEWFSEKDEPIIIRITQEQDKSPTHSD